MLKTNWISFPSRWTIIILANFILRTMDLVHCDVVVWGSPSGAMHCAFCIRQNVLVPPLSHVKRLEFVWVSRKIWLYSKLPGYITRKWLKLHGTKSKFVNPSSNSVATYCITGYAILFYFIFQIGQCVSHHISLYIITRNQGHFSKIRGRRKYTKLYIQEMQDNIPDDLGRNVCSKSE